MRLRIPRMAPQNAQDEGRDDMTFDLLAGLDEGERESIGQRACILRGFALPHIDALLSAIERLVFQAPFRHMATPGGLTMSVALTNCGRLGWSSDRHGYRYTEINPDTGQPWPAMPESFERLAHEGAAAAGFAGFKPDACLMNRYLPGNQLSLHQDKNERDFSAPIVSISLGMPAVFLFGGHKRSDTPMKIPLHHGDVAVWGGEDRLRYHGVMRMREQPHPLLGSQRINLTFRKAG